MFEICFILLLLLYLILIGIYYAFYKRPRVRRLFEYAIFPFPIAVTVIILLPEIILNENAQDYKFLVQIVLICSIMVGVGIIFHCFNDRNIRDQLWYLRMAAALIFILNPFLFLYPDALSLFISIYIIAGIFNAIYGYTVYSEGKKVGILYLYSSIVFMVVIPLVILLAAEIYNSYIEAEIIYRRADDYFITCHEPASPVFSPVVTAPSFLFSIYLLIIGGMSYRRRKRLKRELEKEGVIPKEFDEISNSKEGLDD